MILTTVLMPKDSISSLLSHAIISPLEWENPLLIASYCPPSGSLHQNADILHTFDNFYAAIYHHQ